MFLLTLVRVGTMILFAVPGFILIKTRALNESAIKPFSKLLLYVCSPCLSFYSFSKAEYSPELNRMVVISFIGMLILSFAFLAATHLLLKKRFSDVRWRIFTVSLVCGNVGFFGIPLLEGLLPDHPDVLLFAEVMTLVLNFVAWTYGLFIITLDKKFIKPLSILAIPNFWAVIIVYPMFLSGVSLPAEISDIIVQIGKMSTPLCMIILGMRLANVPVREMVTDWRALVGSVLKMTAFPLAALAVTLILPVDGYVRAALFILACCPCASTVLNLSEIHGTGQKSAANTLLISTIISIVIMPLMAAAFCPAV